MNKSAEQQEPLFPELPPAKYYGKGYAAAPGSGPDGKQCRQCVNFYRKYEKWSKCSLIESTTGTDISMYSPACFRFVELHRPQTQKLL